MAAMRCPLRALLIIVIDIDVDVDAEFLSYCTTFLLSKCVQRLYHMNC